MNALHFIWPFKTNLQKFKNNGSAAEDLGPTQGAATGGLVSALLLLLNLFYFFML